MQLSQSEIEKQNSGSFLKRFYIYQKERFPFIGHGLLIASFTFSAIAYSRICRGQSNFVNVNDYLVGVITTTLLFFLVRILDEFKDQKEDAKNRQYLPIPRGLITLSELKVVGIVVVGLQLLLVVLLQPTMLLLYVVVLVYLTLMTVEFFAPKWLKAHQMAYVTSHMFIIPLVDFYASGIDWRLENESPHLGLIWFFVVSYFNGLVLEFGRKLKTKIDEETNVVSYTGLYGEKGGVVLWLSTLWLTLFLSLGAANYAGHSVFNSVFLIGLCLLVSIPGLIWLFKKPSPKLAKFMEYASASWTILMYISLGGIPMLINLF